MTDALRVVKAELDEFRRHAEMQKYQPRDDHARLMLAAHLRMLEIAAHGAPKTPYPTTHNE